MNCDWTLERIVDFIEGELSAEDYAEVSSHLESCRSCRNESLMLKGTVNILRDGDAEVPSEAYFERLSSSIMNRIDKEIPLSVPEKEKSGLGGLIAWLFERPAYSFGMAAAGAALVLLVSLVTPFDTLMNGGEQDLPAVSLSDSYLEKIQGGTPPSGLVTFDDNDLEYASNYLQHLDPGEVENFFKEVEEGMKQEMEAKKNSGAVVPCQCQSDVEAECMYVDQKGIGI